VIPKERKMSAKSFHSYLLAFLLLNCAGAGFLAGGQNPQDAFYRDALKLIGQARYDEALQAMKEIIQKDATYSRAFAKIIEISSYKKDLDSVPLFFEQLLRENKDNPGAYYGLGLWRVKKQDFPQALENAKKAIALFSGSPLFFQLFVDSSERLTLLDEAQTYLLSLSQSEPANYAALYGLAYLRLKQRKWDESMELLEKAVELDPENPIGYRLECEIYEETGKNKERLALALGQLGGAKKMDPDLEIDFTTQISSSYNILGQYKESFAYDQKMLGLAREIGNKKSEGIALGNMGVYYANVGDFPEALKLFYDKLTLMKEVDDKAEQVSTLSNIGALNDWQGNVSKSLESYREALKLLEGQGDKKRLGLVLGNMGAAYEKQSDYPKSLEYYHQALSAFQETGDKGRTAWILGNLGAIASKLGNDREALDYFGKSLALLQEVGDRKYEGWVLGTMGTIYKGQGETEKSFEFLNRALEIAREIGDKKTEVEHLGNIGSGYQEMGEHEKAADYLKKALQIAEELGDKVSISDIHILLGIVNRDLNDIDRSIADSQTALAIGQELGMPRTIWNSEWGLAISYEKKGDYEDALQHFRNAIRTVESVRGKLLTQEQKVGFLGETLDIYEDLIELLFKLREKDRAGEYEAESFHLAERAKSRAFLELLAEANVNLSSGISQELEAEEKNLQAQLTDLQQKLLDPEIKAEEKENLYKELQSAESRYNDFILELREKTPEYASTAYPEPYTLDRAQARIMDKNTYLLELFLGRNNVYLWLISKDRILRTQSFPREDEVFAKIQEYQTQIAQRKINLDFRLAGEIYDVLLKDALAAIPRSSHLIIIPDGVLLRFPFEALVTEKKDPSPRYLLEDFIISYAPSASVLGEIEGRKRGTPFGPIDLLAFGNPLFENREEAAQADVEYLRAGARLQPLPYAEEEVSSICRIYQRSGGRTESYVQEEALEEILKSKNCGQYKNIHFATHGFVDDRVPALSGLLLAPSRKPDGEDGFLRLNEIFPLHLNARLVTLSACETALGKEVRGEGMIGLTRAFFYAGAQSVMASLWMVSDQSTAILMRDFYKEYVKGRRPSLALRLAKLELLKGDNPTYRHPFFWAPFILAGEY
jgi:CHAT domain-containing protein/tetratricopeptide (TPR) repeat protein